MKCCYPDTVELREQGGRDEEINKERKANQIEIYTTVIGRKACHQFFKLNFFGALLFVRSVQHMCSSNNVVPFRGLLAAGAALGHSQALLMLNLEPNSRILSSCPLGSIS